MQWHKHQRIVLLGKLDITFQLNINRKSFDCNRFTNLIQSPVICPIFIGFFRFIQFAKKDYAAALASYEKVNDSNIASPATFFSAAKTKELMEAAPEEVLALMDSCMARFVQPYSEEAAPYLLERAQMRLNAGQGRGAMLDYDEYYKAVRGNVNDVFYYYREQAAVQAKQFQRALDVAFDSPLVG